MNNRTLSRFGVRLLALAVIFSLLLTPVWAAELSEEELSCASAMLIDADTGRELFSKEPDLQRVPASLTKLMSVYLVYEAMAAGQYTEETVVPISTGIYTFSVNYNYSNVPLYTGGTYTVDELLDAVIIYSACAATKALAELTAGSETAFVELMNQTAEEMELDSSFADSYGGSSSNRVTARGMAKLCYQLLKKYPQFLDRSSKASFTFHGVTYSSSNRFLHGTYSCDGTVDGIKTGTTTAAGSCLVATAYQGEQRVISVVLGGGNDAARYTESQKLLNYGLAVLPAIDEITYVEPFRDVPLTAWYADAVYYVYSNSVMNGTSDTTFEPETVLTRAMMARILYNLEGSPAVDDDGVSSFTDTEAGTWYYNAVEWAAEAGLVQGRGAGIFDPTASITRQEMVTMLYRYAVYKGLDTSARTELLGYSDADKVMDFAEDAFRWSVAEGLIQGAGDGTLNPLGVAQRSQIAQVMMKWDITGA